MSTGRCRKILQESDRVWTIAFSSKGTTLGSCTDDQVAKLWDVATGQILKIFQGHGAEVESVTISPGDRTLATVGKDQSVRLWDIETGECLKILTGNSNII